MNLVEPDRVHRRVYTDADIFDREITNIFERSWIYAGHATHIPVEGDYVAFLAGRQPMLLVRGQEGAIHALYNRCPHRGAKLCDLHQGNTGGLFTCSYHAWQFGLDGQVRAIPAPSGYAGTRFSLDDASSHMRRAARVEAYRGFVFVSLSAEGPSLYDFLGGGRAAFDDMCDRAPDGEVEVVATCFRVVQRSNWKLFLENQLDALHPSITHISPAKAASEVEREYEAQTGVAAPDYYKYFSALAVPLSKWDSLEARGFEHGHCLLGGYLGLRPQDRDTLEYEAIMATRYGAEAAEEILSRDVHHMLIYPCLSVQPALAQLRAVRPLGPDKTLTELWHFRLKGAPEPIYRRSLAYFNLINSPSTMVNADDLTNFWRCQQGLESDGGDWVSFHRNAGQEITADGVTRSNTGLSEMPMRHMFRAWSIYMDRPER